MIKVHPVQISQWKKQLLDGVETLFRDGRRREHEEGQALQAELYEKIGRLNMEIEWLKKQRFGTKLAWIPTALFRANGIGYYHSVFPWFRQGTL